jgi:O-acetyl-ADP-ribose deacetylase (regulator of RNase III)
MDRAAQIAVRECLKALADNQQLQQVRLICFGKAASELYSRVLQHQSGTAE